jgi:exosome complex component RRP42
MPCIQILLISPPLSYPLPLLSLTTHLALLATRLPRLKSEGDEDPMFDDDWEASIHLYPRAESSRPPITLLAVSIAGNIIFDPAKEELAVAEVVLAVSVAEMKKPGDTGDMDTESGRELRLLSVRTVDPPSRLTPPGIPNADNPAKKGPSRLDSGGSNDGVWKAPLGGAKLAVLDRMISIVLEKGGVADEVLDGLETIDLL